MTGASYVISNYQRCVQPVFRPAMKRLPTLSGYVSVALALCMVLSICSCGAPAVPIRSATASPIVYLFSLLDDQAQDGPRTYLSASGTKLVPLTEPDGANIVSYIPGFRDPRLLHVRGGFYYSYTANGGSSPTIGLLYSPDLRNWKSLATPDWSKLAISPENAVWNGAWWNQNGIYYMFFGECNSSANPLVCTPYYVRFNPGSNSFGTPHAISFTTKAPFNYTIVMSVFQSAGKNWAVLQTQDQTGNSIVALASFHSLSLPWTSSWTMIGGQPPQKEAGTAVVLPDGRPRVYYVQTSGGDLYYTTANGPDPATAKWSVPKTIPPFQAGFEPADWVDIVAISDFATLRYMAAF